MIFKKKYLLTILIMISINMSNLKLLMKAILVRFWLGMTGTLWLHLCLFFEVISVFVFAPKLQLGPRISSFTEALSLLEKTLNPMIPMILNHSLFELPSKITTLWYNNNNSLHLYSALLDTQSTLHRRGYSLNVIIFIHSYCEKMTIFWNKDCFSII